MLDPNFDKTAATATWCQNNAHMGPTSSQCGQYMDLFLGKISTKLRKILVLTWPGTKEISLCILLVLELVRKYQKDNWVANGTQVGPKMPFLLHKIVICDNRRFQMHFTKTYIRLLVF